MIIVKKFWFFAVLVLLAVVGGLQAYPAQAVSYGICASGCSFSSISQAFASTSLPVSSVLNVYSNYASSSESFPLIFPSEKHFTVDCQTSTAIIGISAGEAQTISLSNTSTLKNCTLNNIFVTNYPGTKNIVFDNNTALNSQTSTGISFENGTVQDVTVSNNSNFAFIKLGSVSIANVVNNSIYHNTTSSPAIDIGTYSSYITVTSNTIRNYASYPAGGNNGNLVNLRGQNIVFSSNAINFPVNPMNGIIAIINVQAARDASILHNYITLPSSSTVSISAISAVGHTTSTAVTITGNTLVLPGEWNAGPDCRLLYLTDNNDSLNGLDASSTYNIFYAEKQTVGCKAIVVAKDSAGSVMNFSNGYNGFNHFLTNLYNQTANSDFSIANTSRLMSPYFRTGNSETSDDLLLAPFSPYLDVFGTNDIGAYRATRDNVIDFDANQAVTYGAVDATSTAATVEALRSGDVMNLAAGNYQSFSVSSTYVTSSLSVIGTVYATSTINTSAAGEPGIGLSTMVNAVIRNVTVNGASFSDGIVLSNVTSSLIDTVIIKNASSTQATYQATRVLYTYNSNDYNDSADVGGPASSTMIALSGSGCNFDFISTDNTDITASVGSATNNFHIALMRVPSSNSYLTALVPNNYYSSPNAIESDCSGYGIVVDRWVTSTFSVSSSMFTYNSSTVVNAGLTLDAGLTNPPRIDRSVVGSAGIKVVNGYNNTVSSTVIQNNYLGIWFDGNSTSTYVSESSFSGNNHDIKSTTSKNNFTFNSSFSPTSSIITGSGVVVGAFRARAYVQSSTSTIEGAEVAFKDNYGADVSQLTTNGFGYTPYTQLMYAFFLTNTSVSETSGGYNPFKVTASAPTFQTSTTTQNLNTRNQTFTVTLSH